MLRFSRLIRFAFTDDLHRVQLPLQVRRRLSRIFHRASCWCNQCDKNDFPRLDITFRCPPPAFIVLIADDNDDDDAAAESVEEFSAGSCWPEIPPAGKLKNFRARLDDLHAFVESWGRCCEKISVDFSIAFSNRAADLFFSSACKPSAPPQRLYALSRACFLSNERRS